MEADEVTARPRFGTHVPQWAGTLSFLFTDAEGSTELFDTDPAKLKAMVDCATACFPPTVFITQSTDGGRTWGVVR